MKQLICVLLVLCCGSAQAALVERLDGQAYYDTVLDITWAGDALASGFVAGGWDAAVAWAAEFDIDGITGWRLASMDVNGDDTVVDCSSATELACRDNEYGYMFTYNGVSTANPGPITGLTIEGLWSSTEYALDTDRAWGLNFREGQHFHDPKDIDSIDLPAWAVMDGDVANVVPIPAAVWLFGSGLGLLGWMRRKRG